MYFEKHFPTENEIVINFSIKLKFEIWNCLGYFSKKNPAISDGIFFYTELNY